MHLNIRKRSSSLKTVLTVFFALILIILIISASLQIKYKKRIYPNVYIGEIDLGGYNHEEAKKKLEEHWLKLSNQGFEFKIKNERSLIFPYITAPGNPDQTYDLIKWNIETEINKAFLIGHNADLINRIIEPLQSLFTEHKIQAEIILDERILADILKQNFEHLEKKVKNSKFVFKDDEVMVIKSETGLKIDYNTGIIEFQKILNKLENQSITLNAEQDNPEINANDAVQLIPKLNGILSNAPFKLKIARKVTNNEKLFEKVILKEQLQTMIEPKMENSKIILSFGDGAKDYLKELASEINQEPLDAKFEIGKNGKISRFQSSRDGVSIDIDTSLNLMYKNFIQLAKSTSTITVNTIPPQVTTENANNLGIKELLGEGHSDFSGSPKNRRINIKVSSDKLNGLLIPPGEEFSLVESLKPFTAAAGYVPELVIKGNRLIPEIGGGACQIGTTTFRAALDAGLEITERRNHSFAVSYYNDENGLPGTDATIYDPAPDFRFLNNTKDHILIETKINNNDILTYKFWGTSDGRKASTTIPVILSKISPPKTKYIETEDLEPGVTECSGSNVPGYKTTFKYSIQNVDGKYEERNFDSNYRPWQKVCVIGIEKNNKIENPEAELTTKQ